MSAVETGCENTYLRAKKLYKSFGSFEALKDISFSIEKGEFICFLGPSGCGKTTLLRCIAGLEAQTSGSLSQAGINVSEKPPSERDFGIVFQSYALFPNLTVEQNVGYGLINKRVRKLEVYQRVTELLALVNLEQHRSKYPSQLSGGEQQRIALARALATSPGLLLLDEPLSALDAKVRGYLRREIRLLQQKLGVTTIMVTHDQEEAQTMADRIFVMNAGRIEQIGTPEEIYENPASPFVAGFIGEMNVLQISKIGDGEITSGKLTLKAQAEQCAELASRSPDQIVAAIRPEDVQLGSNRSGNNLSLPVSHIEYQGDHSRVFLDVSGMTAERFSIKLSKAIARSRGIREGDLIDINIPASAIHLIAEVE